MAESAFFPDQEFETRIERLRQKMVARDLDACLISVPENIYYLAGLSHQGFFATHLLVVPRDGEMVLIARAMERVTVEAQVPRARFVGYQDDTDPVAVVCAALARMGLGRSRLGMEKGSLFLPPRIAEGTVAGLPQAHWVDVSGLVDDLRQVKSPRELAAMRRAAAVSDAMMQAAITTAEAGVNEQEVAAEVHRAMILAGGEYPGFSPFIRSTPTLGQEHETWQDRVLAAGDVLFLEMAGCVHRYHAPMGRLIFIGEAPSGTQQMAGICLQAFDQVVEAIQPGVQAGQVYRAWQDQVDRAGLSHYQRHHCGYLVGIGFPPTWTGGSGVTGLRRDSTMTLYPGMTFHLLSWLMGAGQGDYFVSDTAVLTQDGCELLTTVPRHVQVV